MPLTLSAELLAAQSNTIRKPIIEIISYGVIDSIPFTGSDLTSYDTYEKPCVFTLSSGRLVIAYSSEYDPLQGRRINVVITDAEREQFSSPVVIDLGTGNSLGEAQLSELSNGNIALFVKYYKSPNYYFKYYILNTDIEIQSSGVIFQEEYESTSPYVLTLNDGSFALVYAKNVSDVYGIYLRTSSDFITWSAESDITPSGIGSNAIRNPSLMEETGGTIWLLFEYVTAGSGDTEVVNIYYATATAIDEAFGSASALTSYTLSGTSANKPKGVVLDATELRIIYHDERNSLYLDTADPLWPVSSLQDDNVTDGHYNETTGKLYAISSNDGSGTQFVHSVVEIDVDSWTITDYWTSITSPAFNEVYFLNHTWSNNKFGVDNYVILCCSDPLCFAVLNIETEVITQYNFFDSAPYGLTKNIDHNYYSGIIIVSVAIDIDNDRVYVLLTRSSYYYRYVIIGYVSLADSGPTYTFESIVVEVQQQGEGEILEMIGGEFGLDSTDDLIWVCSAADVQRGCLRIWEKSTGDLYKYYNRDDYSDFPYNGMSRVCYYDGKMYGIFTYSDNDILERERRGICEIELSTDIVKYHRPTYATKDDYGFTKISNYTDGKLMLSGEDGISIFDTSTETWEVYNNDTVPGLYPTVTCDTDTLLGFDSTSGNIFAAPNEGGVIDIDPDVSFKRIYYITGEKSGTWSLSEEEQLVSGNAHYNAHPTLEPTTNAMYLFWQNENSDEETKIKWDKELAYYDVTENLTNDEIVLERGIDGELNSVKFSVARGHLFDPYNSKSLLSRILSKGRKIRVRIGENVSGTEYFANQGTFVISEVSLTYIRGSYPKLNVNALDKRLFWDLNQIVASDSYSDTPENIIEDLITEFGDMESGDISIPEIETSFTIIHQWVDTTLKQAVDELANRFGYYARIEEDDTFTLKYISDSNDVDHVYTDLGTVIEFSPDDTFSDYINKVVVTGEEQDFTDILLDEERLSTLSGTVGWWGFKKDFDVYWSEDKTKRAKYPRLKVLETTKSIAFQIAGGMDEEITYVDTDNDLYCTVEVTAPNLIPLLLSSIAGMVIGANIPDGVNLFAGNTIPIGKPIQAISLQIALMILGSVGNFQYELWGRPIGYVKRSIQAEANDLDLQLLINKVVETRIEGFLCHTVLHCKEVAEFELMLAKYQRKRVKIVKIADLRDQEGDTISVLHPYSGNTLNIFITNLTRKFKKSSTNNDTGHFIDELEGWIVS